MTNFYVFDACALIAVLTNEEGSDLVVELFEKAINTQDTSISMAKVNLLEVYYDIYKRLGIEAADAVLAEVENSSINIVHEISDGVLRQAGALKATYRISLADSVALALAAESNASLVTCDHHEFDVIDAAGDIDFFWIR